MGSKAIANGWGWVLRADETAKRKVSPPRVGDYCELLGDGCPAVRRENDRGREARKVVRLVAAELGVALGTHIKGGGIWSEANMLRVVEEAREMRKHETELLWERLRLRNLLDERDAEIDRLRAENEELQKHLDEALDTLDADL